MVFLPGGCRSVRPLVSELSATTVEDAPASEKGDTSMMRRDLAVHATAILLAVSAHITGTASPLWLTSCFYVGVLARRIL